jgi:hypothetical protein
VTNTLGPLPLQPCGYYQLKRFAATRNEALKLSFVEDATEYRMTDDAYVRLQRCVALRADELLGLTAATPLLRPLLCPRIGAAAPSTLCRRTCAPTSSRATRKWTSATSARVRACGGDCPIQQ